MRKDKVNSPEIKLEKGFKMPLKDSLFMSPIDKYKLYGRFPWKMIIHILLVIATTAQAILIIANTTKYTRSQERLFYNIFVSDSDKTSIDYPRMTYLYSVYELREHVSSSIESFYNFQADSLEKVEYMPGELFTLMQVNYIENKMKSSSSEEIPREFVYRIDKKTLGPFDYSDVQVKSFLNSITEFHLNYTIRTYVPFYYNDNLECFQWNIQQNYNFLQRAHFIVSMNVNRLSCDDRTALGFLDYFINRLLWIHLIVITLSTFSLILTWKYVYKIAKIYWKLKTTIAKNVNKVHIKEEHAENNIDEFDRPKDLNPDTKNVNHFDNLLCKIKESFSICGLLCA